MLLPSSVDQRSRLPPPKDEVRNRHHPRGAYNRHHRSPQPLRASNLACWPTLEVDERRNLEDAFGNRRANQQPASALAEIAPLLSRGHDIPPHGKDPDAVHATRSSRHLPALLRKSA